MSLSPNDHTDSIRERPRSYPLLDHSDTYVRLELLEAWPQKCAYVVDEILKTEKDYITALEDMVKGYRNPLAGRLKMTNEGSRVVQTIFGNIDDLHSLHTVLLDQLTTHEGDPHEFGRVFASSVDKFKLYSAYCINYEGALQCLQEILKQSKDLGEFIISCQRELGHLLPLSSQLIKPVQRIMRYHMLLHELVRKFDPNLYGYASLNHAHQAMAKIADHVNDVKKQKENALRAKDIENYLTGWTGRDAEKKLSAYGELILESTCRVGKRGVERQVILFEKLLLILKKKDTKRYNYKGHILTEDLSIDSHSPTKSSPTFKVFSRGQTPQTYLIEVPSNKTRQQWVTKIALLLKTLINSQNKEEDKSEFVTPPKNESRSTPGSRGNRRPHTVHEDPRYVYGSARSKRLIGPRKRQRTDIRDFFEEEEESVEETVSVNEGPSNPLFQTPLSDSTNTDTEPPDSSLKYARISDDTELEGDVPLFQIFPRKGVSSSKSSDSLLSLSDVEFGMEDHSRGTVEVDSPPHSRMGHVPRRKSRLRRKAAIKVKKGNVNSSSSYQSLIRIRAQEARRSASYEIPADDEMEASAHSGGEEESELSMLIGTPQTTYPPGSQGLEDSQSSVEFDSLYQSGGLEGAGGPHPPNQSLNNSGYQIEIENLHSDEVKERGRVYDSGIQELEGSTGGVGSYLGDSGEHSSLGVTDKQPPDLETSGHYPTHVPGDPSEGVYGEESEGVYGEESEGGGDDFVILEDSSDSEDEDDDSFEAVPSLVESGVPGGDLVTMETGPDDIIPPPGDFESSTEDQQVPNGKTTQQSTPDSRLDKSLSAGELTQFFKTLKKEESLMKEGPADISTQVADAEANASSPVYYFNGGEAADISGTLPRKPHSKSSATTPSGLQPSNKHLSYSSQTLSRSAARRADGFSRLLEFTRQQQTPEMSPVRQMSAPIGLDVSQSLPVRMAENVSMKLTGLLEQESDRYEVVNGDVSVSGEAGDKSVSGETDVVGVSGEAGDMSVSDDAGDKSVSGDAGDKSVSDDAGDKSVSNDAGDMTVSGDAGDMSVTEEAGVVCVSGDASDMSVSGEAGDKSVSGDAGDKSVSDDACDKSVSGDAGDKSVSDDAGDKSVSNDAGDMTVSGDAGDMSVTEEAGVVCVSGDASDMSVSDEAGDKSVSGDAGDKSVSDDAGDKSVSGDAGDKSVSDDAGDMSVTEEAGVVCVSGDASHMSVSGEAGDKSVSGEAGEAHVLVPVEQQDDKSLAQSFNGVRDNTEDDTQTTSDTLVTMTTALTKGSSQGDNVVMDQGETKIEDTLVEQSVAQVQAVNDTGNEQSDQINDSIDEKVSETSAETLDPEQITINDTKATETLDPEQITINDTKPAVSEDVEVSFNPKIEANSEPPPTELRQRAPRLSTTPNAQPVDVRFSIDKETEPVSNDTKNQTEAHTQQRSSESPSSTRPATDTSRGMLDMLRRFWRPLGRWMPALTARSGLAMVSVIAISSILMYAGLSYSGYSMAGWSGGKTLQDNKPL